MRGTGMYTKRSRAQTMIEYAMLVMIITTALIAMFTYMRRSVNAKLKQVQLELDESKR
jgi:Flp pilus assembly pilin Flp